MKIVAISFVFLLFSALSLRAQTDSTGNAPIAKPRKEPKPLNEKLVFGGSFGLQLGSYTNINLSPIVGYQVTDNLVLGGGPTYIYSSIRQNHNGPKFTYSVYGGRLYGRQRVVSNFHLQAEYEVLNVQDFTNSTDPNSRRWISAPLVGAAYVQPIGNRSSFSLSVLFNLNYNNYLTPYSNPIIRAGFNL